VRRLPLVEWKDHGLLVLFIYVVKQGVDHVVEDEGFGIICADHRSCYHRRVEKPYGYFLPSGSLSHHSTHKSGMS
jgi:hypothetical protein